MRTFRVPVEALPLLEQLDRDSLGEFAAHAACALDLLVSRTQQKEQKDALTGPRPAA